MVDQISFKVPKGSTMALVGESGSGKSTAAKLLLRLESKTSGTILVDGKDTDTLKGSQLLALRRKMQPVFQDPYGSLDPLHSIGNTIAEPLRVHKVGDSGRARRACSRCSTRCRCRRASHPATRTSSGGQRQRVAVARALTLSPTSSCSTRPSRRSTCWCRRRCSTCSPTCSRELGLTYLFITHDLAVVRMIGDYVSVMQRGKIVEQSSVDEVFDNPREKYTQDLLAAIPGASIELGA